MQVIEQALYGSAGSTGYQFLARSAGFAEEWLAEAQRLCTGFGERPAGVACPHCIFARPFHSKHVAVVQVADQGTDDAGRPGALAFRLLVLPAALYRDLGGDPFWIAEQFPPPWHARGALPVLEWTGGPPPARTVAQLRHVLDVPQSPTLLGGVQTLLDGGRLVFERQAPDTPLLRSLWALLPTQSRCELWPASFCFSNAHRFHVLAIPRASGPEFEHFIAEDRAGDYPEGRYELALQLAVESGNQADLNTLLARRSRAQTLRLALGLLVVTVAVALGSALLSPAPAPPPTPPPTSSRSTRPDLPAPEECPELSATERTELAQRLQDLGKQLGVKLSSKSTNEALANDLAALDARLSPSDKRRELGPLKDLGPLQRQVRALLWKHQVPDYRNRGLTTVELIDRLRQHLAEQGILKEGAGG
jgi:hypothetical protein